MFQISANLDKNCNPSDIEITSGRRISPIIWEKLPIVLFGFSQKCPIKTLNNHFLERTFELNRFFYYLSQTFSIQVDTIVLVFLSLPEIYNDLINESGSCTLRCSTCCSLFFAVIRISWLMFFNLIRFRRCYENFSLLCSMIGATGLNKYVM